MYFCLKSLFFSFFFLCFIKPTLSVSLVKRLYYGFFFFGFWSKTGLLNVLFCSSFFFFVCVCVDVTSCSLPSSHFYFSLLPRFFFSFFFLPPLRSPLTLFVSAHRFFVRFAQVTTHVLLLFFFFCFFFLFSATCPLRLGGSYLSTTPQSRQ